LKSPTQDVKINSGDREMAQVYSLSLKEIGERVKKPLAGETLPEWKVEMVVDAAEGFLKRIFRSADSTLAVGRPQEVDLGKIIDLAYLRPLIPIALGIALRRGDVGAELAKLKRTAEYWKGREKERDRRLEEFLSAFRQLARSVVDRGQNAVSLDTVNSLVGQYLSDFLPSEPLRSHVAVVLADILRLIAIPREEVNAAITEGIKSLSSYYKSTLFDYEVMRNLGFTDEEQIRLAHDYLAPAAMLQYYVNRFAAGRAHNILPQIAPSFDQIPENLSSYFPLLPWATLSPAEREKISLKELDSPYKFLTTRGIVTSIGANISINMGPGYGLVAEIASLMGLESQVPARVSKTYFRNFPKVMLGFLKTLGNVLEFLRDRWDEVGDKIDPNKVPTLAMLVDKLGLAGKDSDTVRAVIDDKIAALDNVAEVYKDPSVLVERVPDHIMSLSEALDWLLGSSEREILSNINKLIVEIGVHFVSDTEKRLELMHPFADQAFHLVAGAYLPFRYGLTRHLPPKGKKLRDEMKAPVEEAIVDITNYMVNGPSKGEGYRDWFEKVKGGVELILLGNGAQGAGADYWRQKYLEFQIDWDGVAQDRKKRGRYLKLGDQDWLGLLRGLKERIQASPPERVEEISRAAYDTLRGVVSSAWGELAINIVSSALKLVKQLAGAKP
jgi:hypothetical protein